MSEEEEVENYNSSIFSKPILYNEEKKNLSK